MEVVEKRHSDGTDGLPPIYTQKGKKKKKGRGLRAASAPLTPDANGMSQRQHPFDVQPSRLSMTSRPTLWRSTVSDAGQIADADVAVQLAPMLDRCAASSKSSDGIVHGHSSYVSSLEVIPDLRSPSSLSPSNAAQSAPAPPAAQATAAAGTAPASQQQQHQQVPSPHQHQQQHQLQQRDSGRQTNLQPVLSLEPQHQLEPPPSLWEFFHAEATPHEKYPTADVLWRQTERDRVYNFLLYVPYQLERIMIFGTLLCLYSFLGALTVLPLRCLRTLWQIVSCPFAQLARKHTSRSNNSSRGVPSGAQLYDLLCVLLLLGAVFGLSFIKPGVIYYWMKDITSEFLKIQVIFTALEILDKILSNFGVDVLEALSSTCTLFTRHSIGLMPLVSDFLIALLLITTHGSVLMCQAMVFAVTMNSKANALLALMIATNFVELKGQVYKRTDTNKLWTLACQDIVERFELLLVLCFVVVEDMSNGATWVPAASTLLVCGRIYFWEIIIDIAKHAVLGKFNDIRPGIYREYMRDLCSDSKDNHSHNIHKLVGFCPLGPAALCLRMAHTLFTLKGDGVPQWNWRVAVMLLVLFAACLFQVVLGYSLKWLAYLYVRHHTAQAGGRVLPRAINVTPAGAKLIPAAAAAKAAGMTQASVAAASQAAVGVPGSGIVPGAASQPAAVQGRITGPPATAAAPGGLTTKRGSHSDEGQTRSSSNSSSWAEQPDGDVAVACAGNGVLDSADSSSAGRLGQAPAAQSSSFAKPSAAGVTRRKYVKSPSCMEISSNSARQPGVDLAQE